MRGGERGRGGRGGGREGGRGEGRDEKHIIRVPIVGYIKRGK